MLLEKIFDPLLCGSIPVYFGHKEIDLPSNIYIRIDENINTEKLMTYLNSFKEKELIEYRKRIYDYLLSDDANKYRFQYWAYKVVDLFESEK